MAILGWNDQTQVSVRLWPNLKARQPPKMPTRALPLVSKSGYFQYTGDGAGMKEETETVMKQKANRNAHASAVTLDFKVTCDSSSDSSGWLSLFYPEFLPIRA